MEHFAKEGSMLLVIPPFEVEFEALLLIGLLFLDVLCESGLEPANIAIKRAPKTHINNNTIATIFTLELLDFGSDNC
tara:strand:- start:72 stop:302 length:231 start_codon:yes stop_codon:yes gene_type:complete